MAGAEPKQLHEALIAIVVLIVIEQILLDTVPGNTELVLEPLPRCTGRDPLPGVALGADELRQRVVQVVGDGDRDETG